MHEYTLYKITLSNWEQTRILKAIEAATMQEAVNKALEYANKELFQVDNLMATMIHRRMS